ncbi:MAG TPA: flagellar basal body P-ring protein FlgI [Acetomicrobium sp.]|uniref:flagellar basal body P-ring protein FlgI n=1 Tax=Acetomicrobium sp. TaxID=1872099 RepID=UPI002B260C2F|nr:flagellar basal body P-ring protein FlgI [Acetomicrobium sp.]HPT65267.1 flagellar basal body P-ring protein FlgI [Acetomicrobium sp.]
MFRRFLTLCLVCLVAFCFLNPIGILPLAAYAQELSPKVRVKDLAVVEGARSNQLTGMGLVVGLPGTGDRTGMATRMIRNMAEQYGLSLGTREIRSRNIAAVSVVCNLPPFTNPGQTVDVLVSTLGDAKSLEGGVLLQTPLKAANGGVYAVAQGPVTVGGFTAEGMAARVSKNVTTTGRIAGGAIVERDVPMGYASDSKLSLLLRQPDFTTAHRLASSINEKFGRIALPIDAGRVEVAFPPAYAQYPASFVASLEQLEIRPDTVARVVINERTGTVVLGGNVKISAVAVSHGNLTVAVAEAPEVVQPEPFAGGSTAIVPRTEVVVEEQRGRVLSMKASASVEDLVDALNSIGATPRDIITILQAINDAGALHGELVVM